MDALRRNSQRVDDGAEDGFSDGDSVGGGAPSTALDVPGLVRRVRRVGDWSQRDLAAHLGVSQSSVAQWETGRGEPSLALFARLLGLIDAHLEVVDADGAELTPMRADAVRDRQHRRYPAHLDPQPVRQIWRPRWDRPEPTIICHRRIRRDHSANCLRGSRYWALAEQLPVFHDPGCCDVAIERAATGMSQRPDDHPPSDLAYLLADLHHKG